VRKVAYITSGKIGIHRFTYNELIELKKNGIDFKLCLTQLKPGSWMPKSNWDVLVASRKKAIVNILNEVFRNLKLVFKLFLEAKDNKVIPYFFIALSFSSDLRKDKAIMSLHCQMGDSKLYIGYFLKRLLHLPLTVTVHAHELYQRRVYDNNKEVKKIFSYCDKVITISEFNKKILSEYFTTSDSIEVMRLFPDIDYKNKVKDKTKILVVANWAEKKGYDILLQAIKDINRNDFVLWVVGGSYYSANSIDLEQKVKEYNVEDRVELLGRQGGVVLDIIFSACDIFCLPSYTEYYEDGKPAEREGIPVALMEAMAWGKPVIATKHAGNPELVDEILIEERNVEQLKNAIEYLLNNPGKWQQMGENNRKIIASKYSKDNVKKLVSIFEDVAK
jgi:glycosyltransferase involved in cell wall biosynthesis